jgi:hypothetical protein
MKASAIVNKLLESSSKELPDADCDNCKLNCGSYASGEKEMKLYELGNDKRFTLVDDDSGTVFLLDHIDGAYSVCYIGNAIVHISANAEVEEVE